MPYAIVHACGKQHSVQAGERLKLDRLKGEVGDTIEFNEVLLIGAADKAAQIGQPWLAGAKVTAKIIAHSRGPKIRVFKRRKRKGFHKTIGHRQELTEVEITQIAG